MRAGALRALVASLLLAGAPAPAAAAAADEGCPLPPDRAGRPEAGAGPTPVRVGLHLVDVVGVDDARESFEADVLIQVRWRDPRLALGVPCVVPASQVWSPEFELGNSVGARAWLEPSVRIEPDGVVHGIQRYLGEFRTSLDLRDYPFDRQHLTFRFGSLAYGHEELDVQVEDATSRELEVAGWRVGPVSARTDSLLALSVRGSELRQEHVRVHYDLEVERDPTAYVRRAIAPLLLIVLMSFAVFWIEPTHIGPQLGVATTAMLSLIAFLFALQRSVPPVPYMTRMDHLVLGALALVFLAFVEAVTTSRLAGSGRLEAALRIDRAARVAFPLALAVLVWLALA